MTIRVIIPWRGGCQRREASLNRVLLWWRQNHPKWDIRVGEFPPEAGAWCKSLAVAAAGPVADSDIVIVSDADVICERVDLAVGALRGQLPQHLWAMPHRTVHRLAENATLSVVDQSWWPSPGMTPRELRPFVARSYTAYPGGGLVVLLGKVLNRVPLDPRFRGWGQEDHSWALALSMLAGAPWRGQGALWHLWHPPAPRMKPGIGSQDGLQLWHRYRSAANPEAMSELVSEARAELVLLKNVTAR